MTPTQVVTLGLLAAAWLAIVFPLAMRSRRRSVSGSVNGFHNAMSVLDPEDKVAPVPVQSSQQPPSHVQLLRRVLFGAVTATVATVLAAVAWAGAFIPLAVVSVLGTVGFVGLLRRRKVEQDRARAVITTMREHAGLPAGRSGHRAPQRAPMPLAVGQARGDLSTPDRATFDASGATVADWDAPGEFRDVRLVSDPHGISAHRGFDVLT